MTCSFLALFVLLACGDRKSEESEESNTNYISITKEQFEKNKMALGSLQEKVFPVTVSANGMIDVPPKNRATVSAVMGGYIKRTPLLVGDYVKQGQLLVTLENPEFIKLQQEYLEAKEQLNFLKSEYERHKILFDEKISSQKTFLKIESDYKTKNARMAGLRKQLELLNISTSQVEKGNITSTASLYAPISGFVTQVFISRGTYVSPISPILELIDNSHIHIDLSVFERDIMSLKKGQSILFKIPEVSDQTHMAEVYVVGTAINENRTIQVHGHLMDEKHHFLPGMFVEAKIIIDTENEKALPSESIVEVDGTSHSLRLISEKDEQYLFEEVILETGPTYEDFTKIINSENFENNDQFLVKGSFDLIGN